MAGFGTAIAEDLSHRGLADPVHPPLGRALVECPAKEVFFGGTRGGGKTDGVLGKWALKEKHYGSAFNAIVFRKTTVSAEDAIERSRESTTDLCWRAFPGLRAAGQCCHQCAQ